MLYKHIMNHASGAKSLEERTGLRFLAELKVKKYFNL